MLDSTRQLKAKSKKQKAQGGFTVVELTISIAIIGILSIAFMTLFTNYYYIITRNSVSVDLAVSSQTLLRTMTEELRYGAGVRQSNTIDDPSISGSPPEWNTDNASFVIITAVPALDGNNEYIIDPSTGEPYQNEFVYYKSGETLYKRILAHPDAIGNKSDTSCSPASATASCLADRELTQYVNSFIFTLYDQDNAVTTDPLLARSVKIDLTLQKDTFGSPIGFSNSVRATLRNDFE